MNTQGSKKTDQGIHAGSDSFFTVLADKHNSPVYSIESTVLAREASNQVWKIYDSMEFSTLKRYHEIHNQLSEREYDLEIN